MNAADGQVVSVSVPAGAIWNAEGNWQAWRCVASSADGTKLVAVVFGGRIYTSVGTPPVITYTAPTTPGTYTLGFQVQDDGATNNIDPSPNTLTFDVQGFWLDTEAGPHGSVDVADQWLAPGVTTQITASADSYYRFSHWTGDAGGSANPLNLLMDGSKSVTAHFAALVTTNTGTPYWWLASFGITNDFEAAVLEDPDEDDGVLTDQEYVMNTNPTNGLLFLRIAGIEVAYRANKVVTLSWQAATDRVYDVEFNVESPLFIWVPAAGMTNLVSHTGFLTVTNELNAEQMKMFRLRVRLP